MSKAKKHIELKEHISKEMLEIADQKNFETSFHRYAQRKPCPYGAAGVCCRICNMGPCRLSPKDSNGQTGICGATASTISARNFARMVAGGVSAHSDHGRAVAEVFVHAARGEVPGYEIKDVKKLHHIAKFYGIKTEGRSVVEIAENVGHIALEEFSKYDGKMITPTRAPKPRQELWNKFNVWPRSIDREVVELMHRTTMGTDQDFLSIYLASARCALADGWGGSMIATELQDILFGTPVPVRGKINFGVLKNDHINIIVHGHEPLLSEMIVVAANDKEMLEFAKSKGAKGINIAGICCTANELLMRHGIPVMGSYSQQELALLTGAVDAMVVDVQCIMQGLGKLAECYHTAIITTSPRAKIESAQHIEFEESNPLESAKAIVKVAIERFPKRGEVYIPKENVDMVVGFSHETINYMLGGKYRASYRPLNDNIINGRIKGVAGVVGCEPPYPEAQEFHTTLVKELIANDILVIQTGCSALSCARAGLLMPEAKQLCGPGLREICETVGIPPVLHTGACVDNSRILIEATSIVLEGGLGNDLNEVPATGVCPSWMHEKAIAIGMYFVASGVFTIFGPSLPITGSEDFSKLLLEDSEKYFKAKWGISATPNETANLVIDHINKSREALGIQEKQKRVLYDMEMRRQLSVE